MDFSKKKKIFYKAAAYSAAVFFGLLLIAISVVRAGLEATTKQNDAEKLRKIPFVFNMIDEKKEIKPMSYSLPEIGITPDKRLYFLKNIRDSLWVKFSSGPIKKSKILLLLADKKIVEADLFFKKNQVELALQSSQEAIEKLKYSKEQINKNSKETDQTRQIKNQILLAGLAYEEILKRAQKELNLNSEKYQKIIKILENWNEQQKTIK